MLEEVSRRGVLRGACGFGIPGVSALRRIRGAEDRRYFSAIGGEETALPLQRYAKAATAGGAKAGKTAIYKAIMEDSYRFEGQRLYAPDGAWMCVREGPAPHILIHGVSALARFPDLLKLLLG